jgi:hypothetical protein
MEGSVLSFLKAEWKVSDTGSAQCWASIYYIDFTPHLVLIRCLRKDVVFVFHCQKLNDSDDIGTVASWWNKLGFFTGWITGFNFTWKSQYFLPTNLCSHSLILPA